MKSIIQQEKLQKAAQKAEAAELKKMQKEKKKWEKGKLALKSIVAEIDAKVVELGSIGGKLFYFCYFPLPFKIESCIGDTLVYVQYARPFVFFMINKIFIYQSKFFFFFDKLYINQSLILIKHTTSIKRLISIIHLISIVRLISIKRLISFPLPFKIESRIDDALVCPVRSGFCLFRDQLSLCLYLQKKKFCVY